MSVLIAVMAVLVAAACAGCWLSAERDRRALSAALTARTEEAAGYRAQVMRLSARNAELRDQVDTANGHEPTLTEAWTAFMAELDVTFPEDNR